jgi:integrase
MNGEVLTTNLDLKTIEKNILETPALKDLSPEQLSEIAKIVIVQKYTKEMSRDVELMKFDYHSLKNSFLENISTSKNTKLAYQNALCIFENYIADNTIENILDINNSIADDFIYSLKNAGKFYNICINDKSLNDVAADIETILSHIDNKELKAIILIMKCCGLRVGAFNENFQIKGNKFICRTKGSEFTGTLPANCLKAIRNARLKHTDVFAGWTDTKLKNLFKYHTNNLYKNGCIHYAYSCHDLRHFFAITEYKKDCDIYRVSKLLGHSSIAITEKYLKGMNVLV